MTNPIHPPGTALPGPPAPEDTRGPDGRPSTRVAFQGELGAYSAEAVYRFFGADASPLPCRSFEEVGRAVSGGQAGWGLLPVENTIAGSVVGSYDVLAATDLDVVGEVISPIHHCLLGLPGATTAALRQVLSHPVALAQCARYLRSLPGVEVLASYDTAGAAREVVAAGDPGRAAIAGRGAAGLYGLEVLASDVEDRPDNQTRFFVVTAPGSAPLPAAGTHPGPGGMKAALLIETPDAPGALVDVLRPFAERGINLSKLESRPTGEPWTYRFFVEIDDGADEPATREALAVVRERSTRVRLLGSFPRWDSAARDPGREPG